MTQRRLFDLVSPPVHDAIDLHLGPCEDLLPMSGDLAVADPPWLYRQQTGATGAADHYGGLPVEEIVAHLAQLDAPRMALWITWPILAADWPAKLPVWGRPVTGGAWFKSDPNDAGHYGPGYHWAGCSEPVLIYTRGTAHNDRSQLRNAWREAPGLHSRKPVEWMAQWFRRWVPPGGRVIEPYAGLGATAEAVLEAGEGRTYCGAELDPERHAGALSLLAQWRAMRDRCMF